MSDLSRNLIGATFAVACVFGLVRQASSAPATFPPIVSGTEHRISPTGEVLVSWPYKESKIEVFRVADEKTATYDAGFPIENVAFSVSGRFLCITGYQVKSVQPTTSVSRVAVVDSENEFARTINLTGTRILEHRGPGKSDSCRSPPTSLNSAIDINNRINRMVRIERDNQHGLQCPGSASVPRYQSTTIEHWDPGATPKAAVFAKYTLSVDNCKPRPPPP